MPRCAQGVVCYSLFWGVLSVHARSRSGVANLCLAAVANGFLLIRNDTHGLAASSSSTR